MTNRKQIRSKIKLSGVTLLSALLLASTTSVGPLIPTTAYAVDGPVTLSGTADDAQAALTWAAVAGATGYDVYRNGAKITDTPITDNTYLDTTVINGNTYTYTVSAILGGVSSPQSNEISLLPKSKPGLLRGLASDYNGVTNLTDGDNATVLSIPPGESEIFTLAPGAKITGLKAVGDPSLEIELVDEVGLLAGYYNASSPTNDFIDVNKQHIIQVRAVNFTDRTLIMQDFDVIGVQESPDFKIQTTGLESIPDDSHSQISFKWEPFDGAIGYNLYKEGAQLENKINPEPLTGTTFTDTDVINGQWYTYYLAPITASGEDAMFYYSAVCSTPPPGLLRGIASTTGETRITDGNYDENIMIPFQSGQTYILPAPAKVTGVYADGPDYMQVQLYDTAGNLVATIGASEPTNNDPIPVDAQNVAKVVLKTTNPNYSGIMLELDLVGTYLPNAPVDLIGKAGDAQATLTWTASNGAESYNVYRDGVKINTKPVTETSYSDAGLTNGKSYTYSVTTVNADGESPASNTITLTPVLNLLLNPGFEDGMVTTTNGTQVGKNWTSYAATGSTPNFTVVTSPVSTGTYAQKISGTNIPKSNALDIYQSVAAHANTSYSVSGMYYIESLNNAFVQLYVDFYDKDGRFIKSNSLPYYGFAAPATPSYMMMADNGTAPGYLLMANNLTTKGYVLLKNSFTTPANTASLRMYAVLRSSADGASGTFYVDDLSVVQN
ncbi:hypothetical protein JJB07_15845 [Tumebacillus sp. ITR2]|uniref:Fibronectin type-III domain-containing protein n=1 Tax=Tumebacillus amylolyticus TaxID=2801339 RepID=A0ABS1JCU7_9BACL|nr:hypothetical protein [Tumebacillus amylolyticus]MBL0388091.1 hypothetical protein [Tumebacillus amylolyticus]